MNALALNDPKRSPFSRMHMHRPFGLMNTGKETPTMLSGLQTRTVLRILIQLYRNSEKGFTVAREGLTDGHLRGLFRQFAQQRAQQVTEVLSELEQYCPEGMRDDFDDAEDEYLPCAWTQIRAALGSGTESTLIHKCGEGTENLLRTYENVLKVPLPRSTRALLHRHLIETRSTQNLLKSLAGLD